MKDSQNVRLGQVYVPALTSAHQPQKDESDVRGREQPFELLLTRLGKESLYVPGTPGSGKSIFCRWAALTTILGQAPAQAIPSPASFEEKLPADLRGRFPLLCRLREWSSYRECIQGNGTWTKALLEESLARWLDRTRPGDLTGEALLAEIATGRMLIIFDGVDEIPDFIDPHRPRENFLSGLSDALPGWHRQGHRVLLTSRPYGLDDNDRRRLGLHVSELAALPDELQQLFIRRWYAAADPPRAGEKSDGLQRHLAERTDLEELRLNPMLLTALCVKYDEGQRLPKDFYRLYDSVVDKVLYKRYGSAQLDSARLRLSAIALGMHRGTDDTPRATPQAEVTYEEIDRLLAELAQTDATTESGALDAAARREHLLSNSGLLPRANRRAAFYHLTFQEFFAALRLRRQFKSVGDILQRFAGIAEWRRTLTFLFCAVADRESAEEASDAYASLLQELAPARVQKNTNPALLLANCLEIAHAREWNLSRFEQPFIAACDASLTALPPPERAHLWRSLGRIGFDRRIGVGARNGLPDIDWVEIPSGEFIYQDGHQIKLDTFQMARYPITNAQYQCFIDDDGYANDRWWQDLAERPEPRSGAWNYPHHPRERVSWYEAVAYCRWLTEKLRNSGRLPSQCIVRLPTEQEWEKAARGTNGREYPWGEWKSGSANVDETKSNKGPYYVQATTSVGIYPTGASPLGLLDMAGNVWEWCLNESGQPERTGLEGSAVRVVRGGSWLNYPEGCRCAGRYRHDPDSRDYDVGFRLCCSPSIP